MTLKYFIGIDIAKHSFGFTILNGVVFLNHGLVKNNKEQILKWLKDIKANYKAGGQNTLFCLENTYPYMSQLVLSLTKRHSLVWIENPLSIKLSLGLTRGKTDKIDSRRIAEYCYKNWEAAKLFQYPRKEIQMIKHLLSLRTRLQDAALKISKPFEEYLPALNKGQGERLRLHFDESLRALKLDLKKTEKSILEIIDQDPRIKRLFEILMSVVGVGKIIAAEMIVATNEFKKFSSSKKFACYCGIAPFEYSSGISVKGRTKVSHIANKRMKALLFIAAFNSMKSSIEMKNYYDRKVAEGHPKMSVINAVKNKIIRRVFACVKEDRFYEKERIRLIE